MANVSKPVFGFDSHKNKVVVTPAAKLSDRNGKTKSALLNAKSALNYTDQIIADSVQAITDTRSAFDTIATVLKALITATTQDGETVSLVDDMNTTVNASLGKLGLRVSTNEPFIKTQITNFGENIDKIQ